MGGATLRVAIPDDGGTRVERVTAVDAELRARLAAVRRKGRWA